MTDITIHVSTRLQRMTVNSESSAGAAFIQRNMTDPAPVSMSSEFLDEWRKRMEDERLEVVVR